MKRKTSRKKYQKKLKELNAEICEMAVTAGMRVQDIIKKLNQILTGYFHYYGITDNIKMLDNFLFRVRRSLIKWLNRRSQKRSFNWEAFRSLLKDFPLVSPRIYVSIYGD